MPYIKCLNPLTSIIKWNSEECPIQQPPLPWAKKMEKSKEPVVSKSVALLSQSHVSKNFKTLHSQGFENKRVSKTLGRMFRPVFWMSRNQCGDPQHDNAAMARENDHEAEEPTTSSMLRLLQWRNYHTHQTLAYRMNMYKTLRFLKLDLWRKSRRRHVRHLLEDAEPSEG